MTKLAFSITLCFIPILLAMLSCPCRAATTEPTTAPSEPLPAAVAQFRDKIAAMNATQVLAEAVAEFGRPARDAGSGLRIPQWDVAGGTLTVHPGNGPTFRTAAGRIAWLMPTSNPAGENVLQDFEMTTLPDPANHNTTFWIGNVHLTKDGTYHFTDSGSNLSQRGDQSGNFFIQHPDGRVEIVWPAQIDGNSRLEDLGDRQIARMHFVAGDGKNDFECAVTSSTQHRRLSISAASFEMERGWLHWWPRAEAGKKG